MKAAILGIGTELTDGQTINRNASWISQKLKLQGMRTSLHLVVPDDRPLMIQALDICALNADVIFVTGGLGPTSDDFTRDVLSEWSGLPLHFHEDSWRQTQERLSSRGYTVKEIQKQQCYFPQSSTVLVNPEGTANGFSFKAKGKEVFALPGPPREIEAVWNLSIDSWLKEASKSLDPHMTLLWETLGVGESDVAILVEDILKSVDVDRGYRVHLPYVEVKLMFPKSQLESLTGVIESLDKALADCTFSKTDEDSTSLLSKKLSSVKSLEVQDGATGAFLITRLTPAFRNQLSLKIPWKISNSVFHDDLSAEVFLGVQPAGDHQCEVYLRQGTRVLREKIESPYKTANMKDRQLQYFAERALIYWVKNIN